MNLKFNEQGLIPCVVQEHATGDVLMVAWMNEESLELTRNDCDEDCLLCRVDPAGPACHTGAHSCFYRQIPLD